MLRAKRWTDYEIHTPKQQHSNASLKTRLVVRVHDGLALAIALRAAKVEGAEALHSFSLAVISGVDGDTSSLESRGVISEGANFAGDGAVHDR